MLPSDAAFGDPQSGTMAKPTMPGIGLLNEKPLHAALKAWYAQPGDRFEQPMDGYVIDLVRGDLLVEIQTRNFGAMKAKLRALTAAHRVRLVHPIACEKWIVKQPDGGVGKPSRRKSPRRGRVEDLFRELVSVPWLPANANFSLEVLLIREEEVRRLAYRRRWRTRAWRTDERRLLEVVDRKLFETPADWRGLLPESLNDAFTTRDLSEQLGIDRPLAQQMAYCLRGMGVIEQIGKQGRGILYRVAVTKRRIARKAG